MEVRAVPAKFLVVDDHPLFRDALQVAICSAFPGAQITEASSIAHARDALSANGNYDLVLLDLTMPGTRGVEGLLELRALTPKTPIVVVSAAEEPRVIHEVMTCGASGYIAKSTRKPELAEAIRDVMSGLVYLPKDYEPPQQEPGASDQDIAARVASLTPQQLRVLIMLRQGLPNKQIAYKLNVGETTIKAHVSEILRKLRVTSRTQAVIEVSRLDIDRDSP
ncbi:MAG: response regulator transcription factor [Alphaproteobacteria bacterium]|nr:response regulator transcription factor [Alphaproteobacteria bacterium]